MQHRRNHLVVALSGAHAYGFPSPDSDLDLKAIHVLPTQQLLGLDPPAWNAERLEIVDGVEIDYSSNEILPVIQGILKGNGNYLERILGPWLPMISDSLSEMKSLAQASLSKRIHGHYRGFSYSQYRDFEKSQQPTIKKALYVVRTAYTGKHALLSGIINPNLHELLEIYPQPEVHRLLEAKKQGERTVLAEEERSFWAAQLPTIIEEIDEARTQSSLPEHPTSHGDWQDWLLALRHRNWDPPSSVATNPDS
jgi:uncharacterized protein